jgi:hypothetical protein
MPALTLQRVARRVRPSLDREFRAEHYVRLNQRRHEHLATLGLPVAGRTVLEVGAGIGDLSSFFLDRGCALTITDARSRNLDVCARRFPEVPARLLDLDAPDPSFGDRFEIVYCYGLLYHLSAPAAALAYLGERCTDLFLLETCVSPGDEVAVNPVREAAYRPSQAVSGLGCRPTRPWVVAELRKSFPHVYATVTQPWHEEFPLDWSARAADAYLTRAVFVASREPIDSPLLTTELPQVQQRAA